MTLSDLLRAGFDVQSLNHAEAVVLHDFPETLEELVDELLNFTVEDVELIAGGGGEATPTQRLRRAFSDRGWVKGSISIRKIVDEVERSSMSHEIDHIRETEAGKIALEIEWNNKDTFFDRDLESFQRLHFEGAIGIGIIVTRGSSFQRELPHVVLDFALRKEIKKIDDLPAYGVNPTKRQTKQLDRYEADFVNRWADSFVKDKFGSSTTHWEKLQTRVERGVGNPCPLLLIGIPADVILKSP